ncbi:MAG TPA: glycosyltransferase family 2 protein [Ktedonobacterales bacterium]
MSVVSIEPEWPVDGRPARSAPERPVFSVVAPVYNEYETISAFYARVVAGMEELGEAFELILVDDGSQDGSADLLRALAARDPRVRVARLSRNFGHQMALTAGMDLARGQAVITLDSDLQDPPELIPALVAQWRAGGEVVYAQRTRRHGETVFKRATATAFYRLLRRLTALDIPPDTGDFRLLDRRVVDALSRLRERRRFLRGLAVWAGFRQVAVPYERQERYAGETKYPLRRMLALAMDGVTSFSDAPLRLAGLVGLALLGLGAFGLATTATLYALGLATAAVALITAFAALLAFLSGLQLTFTGALGLYVASLTDDARARPLYIVSELMETARTAHTEPFAQVVGAQIGRGAPR